MMMPQSVHPNKKYSGLWRPLSNDLMDCKTLEKLLDWFKGDLKSAQDYYDKSLKPLIDRGWAPPSGSFKQMVERAKQDIEISKLNIKTAQQLMKSNNCN